MSKQNRKRTAEPRKARPIKPMFGCPGSTCQAVCRQAIKAISHTLQSQSGVVAEPVPDDRPQVVPDNKLLGP